MQARWSKEKAWEWYNKQPWIRGCHYIGSDCANRFDQWQEYGFEEHLKTWDHEMALAESIGFNTIRTIVEYAVWAEQHDGFMDRLDKYLTSAYNHGIRTMLVLSNECAVRSAVYQPPVLLILQQPQIVVSFPQYMVRQQRQDHTADFALLDPLRPRSLEIPEFVCLLQRLLP